MKPIVSSDRQSYIWYISYLQLSKKKILWHHSFSAVLNRLPVQFKAVLRGQKGCVFFSGHPTRHNGISHCLHLYFVCLPLLMEFFSFSHYTKHTLLHGLIFFVKYGKCEEMQFRWANFSSCLYAYETWMYQSVDTPNSVWKSPAFFRAL